MKEEGVAAMQEFFDKLATFSEVVIFGYSDKGKIINKLIKEHNPNVSIIYCDNDVDKQDNIQILSVDDAVLQYNDAVYIIPSSFYSIEKKRQLYDSGIREQQIVESVPEKVYIMEGSQKRLKPLTEDTFRFEFSIVKHCNLNCRSCDHFSPLIDYEMMNSVQFQQDIQRLSVLFHQKAEQILILGGEPLLNPDISFYMQESRKSFPNSKIYIVTNGILLNKMTTDFWRVCKDYQIGIRVTRYPIDIKYESMYGLAVKENIDFGYFGTTKVEERKMWHHPFDLNGNQDMKENFLLCYSGNRCITLENGRLYTCPIPLTSRAFNRYFDKDLPLSEDDYIDIYQAKTSEEILKRLAKPIPFCRYCDVKNRTYDHEWEISKKDIKEWIL